MNRSKQPSKHSLIILELLIYTCHLMAYEKLVDIKKTHFCIKILKSLNYYLAFYK